MAQAILIVALLAASAIMPVPSSQTANAPQSPVKKEETINKIAKPAVESKIQPADEEDQETGAEAREEIVEFVIYPAE